LQVVLSDVHVLYDMLKHDPNQSFGMAKYSL
jgi:hypothetical protein